MELSWDGPDPKDRKGCPYSVNFDCKPAPSESLNSLESGRLLLSVDLGSTGVRSVAARLINNAKRQNLDKVRGDSRLKHQTLLSTELVQDRSQQNKWSGELSIPSSWIEGRTRTYERTGSSVPKSERNLFTLEITYRIGDDRTCTARFGSEDVFHWQARQEARM